MEIEFFLNGKQEKVPQGTTVHGLVRTLDLSTERLAVEYNLQILKREKWEETFISEGDRIEIVHFVGGGGHFAEGWWDLPFCPNVKKQVSQSFVQVL